MTRTLTQAFQETVARHGNRSALCYKAGGEWRTITYQEYGKRARSLACALVELGVAFGDRVALLAENRPEWVISDQGILMAGAATVPIYPTLTPKQTEYLINDCGAKVAIVSSAAQLKKLLEVHRAMPELQHIVVMDAFEQPAQFPRAVRFEDLLALGERCDGTHGAELARRVEALSPDTLASIVYTSGTTGEPKGAMLTHGNFASNAEAVVPILGVTAEDSSLSFLPLSHVFERIANYAVVWVGATVHFAESIDTVPANMIERKPTFVASVPRLFEKIKARVFESTKQKPPVQQALFNWALNVGADFRKAQAAGGPISFGLALQHTAADRLVFAKIRERTGGRIRFFLSGGAPLPQDVGDFFATIGLKIVEGYGLTETSPVISVNHPDDIKIGTVGKPLPGVEVKLGEDNELLVRGPNVMKGYFNLPEATAQAIDAEGFFHTGDVAQFDEAGRVRIVDRKKEIIVMSNGKNVAPQPIENALKGSRFIEQVMLIGDRRNFISALLVPNFEALESFAAEHHLEGSREDKLHHPQVQALYQREVESALESFAKYEKVKKFTLLPREFDPERNELTPTLKVKRRVVSEHFAAEIEAMYTGEAVSA